MPSRIDIAIGHRVRRLRESAGLSEAELAGRLKIYPEELFHLECGLDRIGSEMLDEIARVFGVPVWSFFDKAAVGPSDEHEEAVSTRQERKMTLH